MHDLHHQKVTTKYKHLIHPDFYCSSPHFFSKDNDFAVNEDLGVTVYNDSQPLVEKMRNEGWLSWDEMGQINAAHKADPESLNRYIVVDSIDMIGNYRRIDLSHQLNVTTRAVLWEGDYSLSHTNTVLIMRLNKNFGQIMNGEKFLIKNWIWYNVNTEQI